MRELPTLNMKTLTDDGVEALIKAGACMIEIPTSITSTLFNLVQASSDFFEQPIEEKQKDKMTAERREGYLNQKKLGFDIERYISRGGTPEDRIMLEAHKLLSSARLYFTQEVMGKLLKSILEHLGAPSNSATPITEHPDATLSIIHYPPSDEGGTRLSAHIDSVLLTVLYAPTPGLEINIGGEWVSTKTPPNMIIIQIGKGLCLLTDNKVNALEHRVVMPTDQNRTSIASFYAPPPTYPFTSLFNQKKIAQTFLDFVTADIQQVYSKDSPFEAKPTAGGL
jgi:isopenicillin N synthase-like dioxygenase